MIVQIVILNYDIFNSCNIIATIRALTTETIQGITTIEIRNIARLIKDFKKSDELRDRLQAEFERVVKYTGEGQQIIK